MVWTVNRQDEMVEATRWGVKAILTDYTADLRRLREAMSADFDAAYRAHVGPWFRWGSLRYYTPSVWMYQHFCRAEVEKNAGVRMRHSRRQATYGSAVTSP